MSPKTVKLDDPAFGRVGAALVVANLGAQGVPADIVELGPIDVVAAANASLLSVQVKSTRQAANGGAAGYYRWNVRPGGRNPGVYAPMAFHILALVAVDIGAVAYIATRPLPTTVCIVKPGARRDAGTMHTFETLTFENAINALP